MAWPRSWRRPSSCVVEGAPTLPFTRREGKPTLPGAFTRSLYLSHAPCPLALSQESFLQQARSVGKVRSRYQRTQFDVASSTRRSLGPGRTTAWRSVAAPARPRSGPRATLPAVTLCLDVDAWRLNLYLRDPLPVPRQRQFLAEVELLGRRWPVSASTSPRRRIARWRSGWGGGDQLLRRLPDMQGCGGEGGLRQAQAHRGGVAPVPWARRRRPRPPSRD